MNEHLIFYQNETRIMVNHQSCNLSVTIRHKRILETLNSIPCVLGFDCMMQRPRDGGKRLISSRLLFGLIITIPLVVIYFNIPRRDVPIDIPIVSAKDESLLASASVITSPIAPNSAAAAVDSVVIKKRIAYAITVTKDGPFLDGALVLGHAAKKTHDSLSKYDADLVAFVAPHVVTARPILEAYGWRILERGLPVELSEIKNTVYAEKMKNSGCCGADEFLKLWAYSLTEYHRVVHLDMDSIVFKNMDNLYELDKEMLYTGDYNMQGNSPVPPAQGGFLVVRPSLETFEEFRSIIRKGDHTSRGWGGSRIGNFWGGQTIQGIIPYFYYSVHPGQAQELNRCEYNCMVDNPYRPHKKNIVVVEKCLDKKETCQDCRLQTFENVFSAHFTICQKPWTCTRHMNPKNAVLCEIFHDKWFSLRDEFEKINKLDLSYRVQRSHYRNSLGMCAGYGDDKYLPIPVNLKKSKAS